MRLFHGEISYEEPYRQMGYVLCFMIASRWNDDGIMAPEFLLSPTAPVNHQILFHWRMRFYCDSLKFVVMGIKSEPTAWLRQRLYVLGKVAKLNIESMCFYISYSETLFATTIPNNKWFAHDLGLHAILTDFSDTF